MKIGAYNPSTSIELPHPKFQRRTLLIVEKALRKTWELLRYDPPVGFDLLLAHEDTITYHLYQIIYNKVLEYRLVDGFTRAIFSITREAKYGDYSGEELDKMPDLSIEIKARRKVTYPSDDRLIIECKPVDTEHTVGYCYCGKGLIRFIDGRYAWAMQEAMMIGYIRGNYTIQTKLSNALEEYKKKDKTEERIETIRYPTSEGEAYLEPWCELVHTSVHLRAFPYPQTQQLAPPITIRHLWMRRD